MKFQTILLAAVATVLTSAHAASVSYEFTGGSLVATTSGLPTGVTASNFSLGAFTLAGLEVATQNALKITGTDTTQSTTGGSITANQVLSFSLTIPANVTIDLTSFTYDFTSSGLVADEGIAARLYSSIDPYNTSNTTTYTTNTIGMVGKYASSTSTPPTSATPFTISLTDPSSNINVGSNVTASDFTGLTNTTVTFYMPMFETGPENADFTQLDNITLNFEVVPEPSAALLGGLGLLALLRRRR